MPRPQHPTATRSLGTRRGTPCPRLRFALASETLRYRPEQLSPESRFTGYG